MKIIVNTVSVECPSGYAVVARIEAEKPDRLEGLEIRMDGSHESPVWALYPLHCIEYERESFVPEWYLEIFDVEEIIPVGGAATIIINLHVSGAQNVEFRVPAAHTETGIEISGPNAGTVEVPAVADDHTIEERRMFAAESFMEDEGFASDLLDAAADQDEAESLFAQGEEWSVETADETIRMHDQEAVDAYIILRINYDSDSVKKRVLQMAGSPQYSGPH